MAQRLINIGTGPNTKDGDSVRNAFDKANQNFTELYGLVGESTDGQIRTDIIGSVFADDSTVLVDAINQKIFIRELNVDGQTSVGGHIIPEADNTHDLGSPTKQWRHVYTSGGSIYLDNIKLTNVGGKFTATKVINPGEENEAEDPEDSDATSEIRGGGAISVGDGVGTSVSNVTEILINGTITEIEPGLVGISVTGEGLPSITIPATPLVLYKGLQASYGVVHSNNNSDELNVNKIVIHKPATTTVTIDPTGSNDDFQVSGLGSSDVLAMFVVYGDVNGAKPLSDLQNFTRSVIDNVILVDGVEDDFRTVDQMKAAFYADYATLATAAGGLYTNFEFYITTVPTLNGGPTTVREGSGTVDFTIFDNGDGTYTIAGVSGGTNYLTGHKIKILGTAVGGVTPDNDIIITVVATNGEVVAAQDYTGLAAGNTFTQYFGVTGTNYNVGSGFTVNEVYTNGLNVSNYGTNYVVDDVITLLGENILNGTTPTNNFTISVTSVGGSGEAYGYNINGTLPEAWPTNNINDGGQDQYDTANYINTNLANEINYNGGNTVVDGTAAFGAGSTYSFVYDTAIFGLFVTGNGATSVSTSGNSGADGGSTTETGNVFGGGTPEQTFDNAVTHINIIGDPYVGEAVSFLKTNDGSEVDILIPNLFNSGDGVGITRDSNNGIYNPYREGSWDSDVSPGGTLWNIDGWADLTDVESRTYTNFYAAFGNGGLGNKVIGAECVMYLPDNGKYYAVKFSQWTQGQNGGGPGGGGFAYTRRELDLTSLAEGIRFSDGTVLKSAAGLGRVKLESPGNRRIEEVYGYKQVSVTAKQTVNITAIASRNASDEFRFWIDTTTTNIDDILGNTSVNGIWDTTTIEFSLDNATWYRYDFNSTGAGNEIGYGVILPSGSLNYSQGDNIYFRYQIGGEPVVWWDSADLPSGSTYFRGAIIKYHAYITDSGSMVGTIHIAKDSGDENIFHTEVLSGGTDGENAILWYQDNENQIKYKRIDGEDSTAKIQWSATVFYGSEVWD